MGVHRAFGLTGGPRRVDDQGVGLRIELPGRDDGDAGRLSLQVLQGQHGETVAPEVGAVVVEERHDRTGIVDHVGDLGRGGRRADGHQDRATTHDRKQGFHADSVDRAHHSTRSPGPTPRAASAVARAAVRPSRLWASTVCAGSRPLTSTGAPGRAAQCSAHAAGRVPPPRSGGGPGHRPGGTSALTTGTARHSLAVMTARRIAIVPHTHWDREWYKSYQDFRLNLVDLIDTLLPLLEGDASYPHFMLDGQMAVVDDYLEVRPEAEGRLRALAAAGRLSMGPWYILMDEFLASGETIIRNLQMGLVRGAAFGGVMEVGYLPDMFGHIAQMPQILRLAGFDHAVVWRGVPSQVKKNAFAWEAPDGSTVRAEYLPVGYGNGAALPDDAKALIRRTSDHIDEVADFLIDDLLCMNGSDHLMPQPWLGRVVAEANDLQDDFVFEVTSLPHYLANATTEDLTVVRASCGRAPGPTCSWASRRTGSTSSASAHWPNASWNAGPSRWRRSSRRQQDYPDRLLDLAWLEMVRNSAHDSICACSVDDVVDAVLHRYAEARTIAAGLADRAVKTFARSLSHAGPYCPQPVAAAALGRGRAGRAGRRHRRPRASRCSPSAPACPGRWSSTPTRCGPCSACCRVPASATTPGCRTC